MQFTFNNKSDVIQSILHDSEFQLFGEITEKADSEYTIYGL